MAFLSCSSRERWTAIGIKKGSSMDWPQPLSGHKGLRCSAQAASGPVVPLKCSPMNALLTFGVCCVSMLGKVSAKSAGFLLLYSPWILPASGISGGRVEDRQGPGSKTAASRTPCRSPSALRVFCGTGRRLPCDHDMRSSYRVPRPFGSTLWILHGQDIGCPCRACRRSSANAPTRSDVPR